MYDALSIPNFNDAFNAGTCELDQLFIVQPAINDGFKNQVSNTEQARLCIARLSGCMIDRKNKDKNENCTQDLD